MTTRRISGIITDVHNRRRYPGELIIENGYITDITEVAEAPERYILPGFVDSHIHIESSMLVPSEFARLAVKHGTVATVSDPHEIANVCGIEGVRYMIGNGESVPLKFHFGAPSCVPATEFETAGAWLDARDVACLLDRDDIFFLAEMMNWPGVLNRDEEVMTKIMSALERGKPVDGHAPGLRGSEAFRYASAGISTDHECVSMDEALDKIRAGMKIAIREGSAAKNFEALIGLLGDHAGRVMFCSDDKHPDDLFAGHINQLAARALAKGCDLYDVLRSCSVVPAEHYGLKSGLLRPGDPADFIITNDLKTFEVKETWIDGRCVYSNGEVHFDRVPVERINRFTPWVVTPEDFRTPAPHTPPASPATSAPHPSSASSASSAVYHTNAATSPKPTTPTPVIIAFDGDLITGRSNEDLEIRNGEILADPGRDILKVAVVNRYRKAPPATGFIRNFGLRNGAIASSVAHDSHNIIAVGSSDEYISRAVNLIMEARGGIAAVSAMESEVLPLPVAGIMSDSPGTEVAAAYQKLNRMAIGMGSKLRAPFMLISFMALLVIPRLKISDLGMFDGEKFEFIR
jgi:adenine deaminase